MNLEGLPTDYRNQGLFFDFTAGGPSITLTGAP